MGEPGDGKYLERKNPLLRFKTTMEFVRASATVDELRIARVMDVGEYNPFSKWLKDNHGISVVNTPADLDSDYCCRGESELGESDHIFAVEIIEHLINPLAFLEFLRDHLEDGGILFLTTPFLRPGVLWSKYHVTEYFTDKIETMADKAGFVTTRYEVQNSMAIATVSWVFAHLMRAPRFERNVFLEMKESSNWSKNV